MAVIARSTTLVPRQEDGEPGSFTVTIDCTVNGEYDGRMGLRISSIFVIFIGSMLGCIGPLLLHRSSNNRALGPVFFAAKFFGSGVIIATAFIHLLAPAISALYSPCLDPDSPITKYAWPEGICLMSVFAIFFVELVANYYVSKPGHGVALDLQSTPQPAPRAGDYKNSERNDIGAASDPYPS